MATEPTDPRRTDTGPRPSHDAPKPPRTALRLPALVGPNSLPPLVRFLLGHALIGFVAAALFVTALITLDIGGIGTVLGQSDLAVPATLLLTFVLGLTFASVQMGIAVMTGNTPDSSIDNEKPR